MPAGPNRLTLCALQVIGGLAVSQRQGRAPEQGDLRWQGEQGDQEFRGCGAGCSCSGFAPL